MEKIFKYTSLILAAVILLSSVLVVFTAPFGKKNNIDLFGCEEIVQNIKNCELNMTSIIYCQNSDGAWEEYQRIHGTENRIWVDIEDIPQDLVNAFIAIEDQRYYSHSGIDIKRTFSAFLNYLPFVELYSSNQGGSSITQQLIKNLTADKDKSAMRKVREIIRALMIEKTLDKTTILEAYLNTISLGNGICGVQVASNYYFNKDVSSLSLAECASLAAITKNPSAYNPDKKPEGNEKRRKLVLKTMLEQGKISRDDCEKAFNAEIIVDKSQQSNFEIPINNYFVDTLITDVTEKLAQKYGCSANAASYMLYNGGYRIYSSVNPKVQTAMEDVYLKQTKYFAQRSSKDKTKNVQSAMTVMDYQGHIVGIVGGAGEKTVNRGLNRAIDSPRQPGSTMKPIGVYTLAIDTEKTTYSTFIEDKPMPNYYADGKPGPREWYGHYAGNMSVKTAIERSANTIPCWLLQDIGVENSYRFLTEQLGMKHLTDVDKNIASLALGGCQYGITTTESAAAYAIYGNGGKYYEPSTFYKVVDANDQIVLGNTFGKQVIREETATVMNRLLQGVIYGSQGTGGSIGGYSSMKAYGKTGTSSESNDLWMVAGTPYYVASVWYGFDQPEKIHSQSAAATVWRTVMSQVHKGLEKKEFTFSENVVKRSYCLKTGRLAGAACDETATGYYLPNALAGYCDGTHPVTTNPEVGAAPSAPSDAGTPSDAPSTVPSDVSSTPFDVQDVSSEGTTSDSSENSSSNNESDKSPNESGVESGSSSDNSSEDNKDQSSKDTPNDDNFSKNNSSASKP